MTKRKATAKAEADSLLHPSKQARRGPRFGNDKKKSDGRSKADFAGNDRKKSNGRSPQARAQAM
jgi:hypothetical protein